MLKVLYWITQQAQDVNIKSGWRQTNVAFWFENENQVDASIWRQFDVDFTLDFGYTT